MFWIEPGYKFFQNKSLVENPFLRKKCQPMSCIKSLQSFGILFLQVGRRWVTGVLSKTGCYRLY